MKRDVVETDGGRIITFTESEEERDARRAQAADEADQNIVLTEGQKRFLRKIQEQSK